MRTEMNIHERVASSMLGFLKRDIEDTMHLQVKETPYTSMEIEGKVYHRSLLYEIGNTWSAFIVHDDKIYLRMIPIDPSKEDVTEHFHKYYGRCASAREFKIILDLLEIK